MAQKNFFAIVTLIACMLLFIPAEWFLFASLSGKSISATTLAIANIFGIIAAIILITAVFKRKKSLAIVWCAIAWSVLSCIIAAFSGWAAAVSLFGGGFLLVTIFALFVLAIIRYEDLGHPRR